MRRREFITLVGSAAASTGWPLAARAQQPAMPVIGFLHIQAADSYARIMDGFRQGLKDAGFIEGQNVAIEYRWANDQLDRLPTLAGDLVGRRLSALVAGGGTPAVLAAMAATSTLPIVIVSGQDPAQAGFVASLNRPGGNVTGVSFFTNELGPKRLDLLRELVPHATTIAFLVDPRQPNAEQQTGDVVAAARLLGREIIVVGVRSEGDFEAAFENLVERRAGALLLAAYSLFTSNRAKLLALADQHKIPTIYPAREFALEGGLLSYGASQVEAFRLGGGYVAQILKGAKPADMPVMLPTKFELTLNLKIVKALGLTVSPGLLAIADEVIE